MVRRWFILYGPESADFKRQDYDTVTWVWAAAVTVMTNVHRQRWSHPNREEPTDSAMVAGLQAVVWQAAVAEMYATEQWRPPATGGVARWGQRQARTLDDWMRRWQGIAQCCDKTVKMFFEPGYDETEARLLVGKQRQDWGTRRWANRST